MDEISRRVKLMNDTENEIAIEWYGVPFDELDYDEKELVTFEMQDRLGIGLESN